MTPEQLRQRTKGFAIRIIGLTRALPRATEAQVIGRQSLRPGTSIGANHRAACRARSRAESIAKLGIVIEEADETMDWLELLVEGEIAGPKRLQGLLKEAEELTRIFVAARQSSKQWTVDSQIEIQEFTNRKSEITYGRPSHPSR